MAKKKAKRNTGGTQSGLALPDNLPTWLNNDLWVPKQFAFSVPRLWVGNDPRQPRKSFPEHSLQKLAQQLQRKGFRRPILVRVNSEWRERAAADVARLIITSGERRWRAAGIAELEQVLICPDNIADDEFGEADLIEDQLTESGHTEKLNIFDQARAIQRWMDINDVNDPQEVATEFDFEVQPVRNMIALLELPEKIFAAGQRGEIAPDRGLALIRFEKGSALQEDAARRARARATVSELLDMLRRSTAPASSFSSSSSQSHSSDARRGRTTQSTDQVWEEITGWSGVTVTLACSGRRLSSDQQVAVLRTLLGQLE